MNYCKAQSIFKSHIPHQLLAVFFVPVLKLYLREYLTVFPIQGFAKKPLFKQKIESA